PHSGALLRTLEGHSDSVGAIAFSADGKQLASAPDQRWYPCWTVNLWDPHSGALLRTLEGHSNVVRAIAFSADGKKLASASDDSTVRLWDPHSGELLQQTFDVSNVYTLSFSNDGTYLQTNMGSLPISSPSSSGLAVLHRQLPPAIFVKNQWMRSHTEPILWLPPEHRPDRIAVHGSTVDFGLKSGRVTIMELAL
ncbi:WD40 repeat-like protein, partial [Lepidopterella palustris CBS 459.81]